MNLQAMKRAAVPLHAEVAEVLRHQIMSGELPAGAKLPALRELTETLGVARMTVVQAMNTLQDEGLIEKHSGKGTFVRRRKVKCDLYKVLGFTKNMTEMGLKPNRHSQGMTIATVSGHAASLLTINDNSLAFLIKGVTFVEEHEPIECEESLYRSDNYALTFDAIVD